MADEETKLHLEYPCAWSYKVIGRDPGRLRQAIAAVVGARPCRIAHSRGSSGGKYHSLLLELEVRDEPERTGLYLELKAHPDIILVM